MKKQWKPKQRSGSELKICRWCGGSFSSEYDALYCVPRCRYAYRNEMVARKAKKEGVSIREFQFLEKLLNITF